MVLSNKVYDILKKVVQVGLPGSATLYVALAGFWDFPNATAVSGSITAVATFLGLLLGVSTKNYNKVVDEENTDGQLLVSQVDGETYLSLGLTDRASVEKITTKNEVRLKVVPNNYQSD